MTLYRRDLTSGHGAQKMNGIDEIDHPDNILRNMLLLMQFTGQIIPEKYHPVESFTIPMIFCAPLLA